MKFSCTQENLNRGLALVTHITGKNVNLPILHNVLVEAKDNAITLSATNLEIGIRVRLRGKVDEAGSFTVPAQVFASYVGLVSAEKVDVERADDGLNIQAGNQNTKIKGEEATEFPMIPEVVLENPISVPASELKMALAQTIVAVSHDDSRPELTGVYTQIEDHRVVFAATDSYRLAERALPIAGTHTERQIIVPGMAMQELVRVLPDDAGVDVRMYFSDSQALFMTDEVEITTRLIEGNYPDYRQIIPMEEKTKAVVDRYDLVKAVKAASLFSKSGIHDVNLQFSPDKQGVTLTTVNNQVGENVSKVNAEIVGDSNSIIFNHRYLLDGVQQVSTPQVVFYVVDGVSPGIIRPHGGDTASQYTYIIMPIKQ
ncbi:MAG: DNA polymerase III subunit beta [Candidatus Kerfeldbacteria bacterium CG15_BIG_FIL_POST_REV_8_21_14_020_45_12]|uniref:Beta sliding clamp n=1 Tax=Candidatus Kerfeldbacteria bacterium CG15_BIG_FIL_POST_REV_8_21_14_020_45_12 TaxID=2014247 RepID=A0A2M7H318_9BACT|nr:MAG: DNA polymerase III subunit beta [Candidatus Kerfeldbacteria bacterium CG15_BIG_FIL_POST_REV_8_21_14_020_45_12]PJA93319.1 MAG: DNA polymerase III subunit beta [Candidatus Kerfeldbacteria bacterium CG_4_9_14_3_um_filter_45_8]